MYTEMRAELTDNENLLKTYQKTYDDLGRKYDDALLKIDKMSTNPNFSGKALDKLHNEIIDRDDVVNRLVTEVMPKGRRSTAPVAKLVVQSE